jgi:hypothetical protein
MDSQLFRYEFAVITIFCVVSIFLFPIAVGPYPAVHGPATAIQALHAAVKLRWIIAVAALASSHFAHETAVSPWQALVDSLITGLKAPKCSILRC